MIKIPRKYTSKIFKRRNKVSKPHVPKLLKKGSENTQKTIDRKFKLLLDNTKRYIPTFTMIFSIILLGVVFYNLLKTQNNSIDEKQINKVNAIDIFFPVFPNSKFAFEGMENDEYIKEMLLYKISCYTVPDNYTYETMKSEYIKLIKEYKWDYIGEATFINTDKEIGIYFVDIENKVGVRVYNLSRDIWYEQITVEEARNMLSNRKELKTKLKETIKSLYGESLPDKYPFDFRYSYEYKLEEIYNKNIDEYGFSLSKKENKILVVPYNRVSLVKFEEVIPKYITQKLGDTKEVVNISGLHYEIKNEINFYIGNVSYKDELKKIAIFENIENKTIYVIDGMDCDDKMLDYLIEIIKVRK